MAQEITRINGVINHTTYCDFLRDRSEFCRHVFRRDQSSALNQNLCSTLTNVSINRATLVNNFCAQVQNTCQSLFPAKFIDTAQGFSVSSCVSTTAFSSGGLPSHATNQVIEERRNDINIRKEIFENARQAFSELANPNGAFAEQCCQSLTGADKEACKNHVGQTNFKFPSVKIWELFKITPSCAKISAG